MEQLSKCEVKRLMDRAEELSENESKSIINDFDVEQPVLYQAIYGQLFDSVAQVDSGMIKLFEKLCFKIIFFYYDTFGDSPIIENEEKWLVDNVSLLDAELKALSQENIMDMGFRNRLLDRLVQRSQNSGTQLELHKYINGKIQQYISNNNADKESIQLMTNLLFVIIRLMDELYKNKHV